MSQYDYVNQKYCARNSEMFLGYMLILALLSGCCVCCCSEPVEDPGEMQRQVEEDVGGWPAAR